MEAVPNPRKKPAIGKITKGLGIWLKVFSQNFVESFAFAKLKPWPLNLLAAPFFLGPSVYFANLLCTLNQKARDLGFLQALRWGLGQYYGPTLRDGPGSPALGPLLVVANHPGLGDFPALVDALGRDDVRVIVKERKLMADMDGIMQNCIVINESMESRAKAILSAVEHLAQGGCLMVFPAGEIEEDPGLSPGSASPGIGHGEMLKPWFPIVDGIAKRFLKKHQGLVVQGALIHHVYHMPSFFHPLLARSKDSAIRSGRAALITMALPKTRTKCIQVSFLQARNLSAQDLLSATPFGLQEHTKQDKGPAPGLTETLRTALLARATEIALEADVVG